MGFLAYGAIIHDYGEVSIHTKIDKIMKFKT